MMITYKTSSGSKQATSEWPEHKTFRAGFDARQSRTTPVNKLQITSFFLYDDMMMTITTIMMMQNILSLHKDIDNADNKTLKNNIILQFKK